MDNAQLELAKEFVASTNSHIFLTGKAGTGKTTFLRNIHLYSSKQVVVTAPTGVAALNAGGVTLHSLFQLPFAPFVPSKFNQSATSSIQMKRFSKQKLAIIRSIELLVIDEISMVRSDTLDAVDETLRQIRRSSKPFGGVQMLMIGDVNQLSPIIKDTEKHILDQFYESQYFFDSLALKECNYITIELEKIYRQSDTTFTDILNDIRERRISQQTLTTLNNRYIQGFNPDESEGYIRLTTHNYVANKINEDKLRALSAKSAYFEATIKGDFPEHMYPNDLTLEFKVGAKVIFIKNDSSPEKLYYNGMRGEILDYSDSHITVLPQDSDESLDIFPETWDNIEYKLNEETSEIDEYVKGSFVQFPLKCAWAITIHKSQGLTFDKAIIDTGAAFAYGQVYVALSRIRTLEGVVLSSPITPNSIISSCQVDIFNNYIRENKPDQGILYECKKHYFETSLVDIFDFATVKNLSYIILKIITTNLYRTYPTLIAEFEAYMKSFDSEILNSSKSFQKQIRGIIATENYETSQFLKERVQKGAIYYTSKFQALFFIVEELRNIDIDSKEVKKRFTDNFQPFILEVSLKQHVLKLCSEGFDIQEYQKVKAKVSIDALVKETPFKTKAKKLPKEVIHAELYNMLIDWRKAVSSEISIKTSSILQLKSIIQIQATLPCTVKELRKITGIGAKTIANYAEIIVNIVKEFCISNDIDPLRDGFSALQFDAEEELEKVEAVEEAVVVETVVKESIVKEPKKTKKSNEPKPPKILSHNITLALLREGHDIEKIAEMRELSVRTIMEHAVQLIQMGAVECTHFMSEERCQYLRGLITPLMELRLGEIKENLPEDISYFEIKAVIASMPKS